jgi:hypothetical protein
MGIKKQNGIKYYTPHEDLMDLLKKELHKKKATKEGKELGEYDKEKRKKGNIDRLKVYYLDKHIFQAMANLAFFFEAIAKHPELEDLYGDDIRDLLGVRRNKSAKHICGFMFFNLLRDILKVDDLHLEREEGIQPDFRLILNHHVERIVRNKVSAFLAGGYKKQNGRFILVDFKMENVRKVILHDFSRALAWTGMLASSVDNTPDDEEEPHRTFDFRTDELLK